MDNNKWPIAKITFAALLCLQVVTVGLMILSSYLWGEEAYLKHVRGLMRAVATESVQSVENLMQPAEYLIRSSSGLMESGVLPTTPNEMLERYFFEQLSVNTNFSGMYFGWVNGDFLFVKRNPSDKVNPFLSKYIVSKPQGRSTVNIHRSTTFSEQFREKAKTDYDPRTRPWFKVVGLKVLSWTDPYIHFTSGRPGITVSIPVLNKKREPIGVLGLDIEITNLSYFLSKNELSPNSSALIATKDKGIVAHTDFDAIMEENPNKPGQPHLLKIDELDDEIAKKAVQVLEATGQKFVSNDVRTVKLEYNNKDYHAVFHSYSKLGFEWTVLVTAPESDFMEMIRNAQHRQIITAVISSLAITLFAFLVALRFLKPVGELQESVLRNPLTGLYNRRALDSFGNELVKKEHARGGAVSIAMIDIDLFKSINDTYGHQIGDEVLVVVSKRMSHVLKKTDVLARYGGEEFVLLMMGADLQAAQKICERLRLAVSQTDIVTGAGKISVAVSIGVTEIAVGDDFFGDALAVADQALYLAKQSGRDQVCTADESCIGPPSSVH